ncbi:MAG: hypothetical protein WCJ58_06560 [bacterium]
MYFQIKGIQGKIQFAIQDSNNLQELEQINKSFAGIIFTKVAVKLNNLGAGALCNASFEAGFSREDLSKFLGQLKQMQAGEIQKSSLQSILPVFKCESILNNFGHLEWIWKIKIGDCALNFSLDADQTYLGDLINELSIILDSTKSAA